MVIEFEKIEKGSVNLSDKIIYRNINDIKLFNLEKYERVINGKKEYKIPMGVLIIELCKETGVYSKHGVKKVVSKGFDIGNSTTKLEKVELTNESKINKEKAFKELCIALGCIKKEIGLKMGLDLLKYTYDEENDYNTETMLSLKNAIENYANNENYKVIELIDKDCEIYRNVIIEFKGSFFEYSLGLDGDRGSLLKEMISPSKNELEKYINLKDSKINLNYLENMEDNIKDTELKFIANVFKGTKKEKEIKKIIKSNNENRLVNILDFLLKDVSKYNYIELISMKQSIDGSKNEFMKNCIYAIISETQRLILKKENDKESILKKIVNILDNQVLMNLFSIGLMKVLRENLKNKVVLLKDETKKNVNDIIVSVTDKIKSGLIRYEENGEQIEASINMNEAFKYKVIKGLLSENDLSFIQGIGGSNKLLILTTNLLASEINKRKFFQYEHAYEGNQELMEMISLLSKNIFKKTGELLSDNEYDIKKNLERKGNFFYLKVKIKKGDEKLLDILIDTTLNNEYGDDLSIINETMDIIYNNYKMKEDNEANKSLKKSNVRKFINGKKMKKGLRPFF